MEVYKERIDMNFIDAPNYEETVKDLTKISPLPGDLNWMRFTQAPQDTLGFRSLQCMGSRFLYDADDEYRVFKDVKEGDIIQFRGGYKIFSEGDTRLKSTLPADDWVYQLAQACSGIGSAAVAYAIITLAF